MISWCRFFWDASTGSTLNGLKQSCSVPFVSLNVPETSCQVPGAFCKTPHVQMSWLALVPAEIGMHKRNQTHPHLLSCVCLRSNSAAIPTELVWWTSSPSECVNFYQRAFVFAARKLQAQYRLVFYLNQKEMFVHFCWKVRRSTSIFLFEVCFVQHAERDHPEGHAYHLFYVVLFWIHCCHENFLSIFLGVVYIHELSCGPW